MATFRNTTTSTLSLGTLQLAPNATVVDTEHDATVLENIQYFYESDKLTLVSGTPDFTSVTASESGVIQYTTVQWTSLDPVLGANIIGVDTTLGTIKIGNGTQHYSALNSIGGSGSSNEQIISVSGNMSNVQASGAVINNYGQAADVIVTLPACAKGMNFIFLAGTTVAKYYRFTPAAGDSIYLDGTTTGDAKYVALATVAKSDSIQFVAYQTGASAYDWYAVSAIGNWSAEA